MRSAHCGHSASRMSSLLDLQRAFQTALVNGDASALICHVENRAIDRITIYQDAYRIRLREALASNYPQFKALLGAEAFDSIADSFMDASPSSHPSIRWFGWELASSMSSAFPERPELAELAQLEWALSCAFDAEDAEAVQIADLSGLDAELWPRLRFTFHPSVRCLALHTNAAQIYKALTQSQPAPPSLSGEPTSWVVWRDELTPRYRSLPKDEADALDALMAGNCFEDMCTRLCTYHAPDEVAARAIHLLQQWLNARMICGLCAD